MTTTQFSSYYINIFKSSHSFWTSCLNVKKLKRLCKYFCLSRSLLFYIFFFELNLVKKRRKIRHERFQETINSQFVCEPDVTRRGCAIRYSSFNFMSSKISKNLYHSTKEATESAEKNIDLILKLSLTSYHWNFYEKASGDG